jgi:C_GCAxxG_C_C family probable redox protein
MNRKELLSKLSASAFAFERDSHGCAQAAVKALMDYFPIEEIVFKLASPCSGGIANAGTGPCGGFIGGTLVFGYFFGRDFLHRQESGRNYKDRELVNSLRKKYHEHFGGLICRDIQKTVFGHSFDLFDPADREKFEMEGGHDKVCPNVVAAAVGWIAELLIRENITPRVERQYSGQFLL